MKVFVSLYTILKAYGENTIAEDGSVEVGKGTTLGELSNQLGIPPKLAKVYLVGGLNKKPDYTLKDTDDVKIFSFIGGG
ncbi:MAG: hypothetical protein HN368_07420 [Spirochaetales bacterium]|jgi:sulfur carrier protein ThiS|nr:hypothetical protein [Spirochaetales bacterium]